MDSNRNIFPDKELEYTEDIFPSSTVDPYLVKERREFLVGLAERYADREGMPVSKAVEKATYEGGKSITPTEGLSLTEGDVVKTGYERRLPASDLKKAMDNFYENKKILANSYEDRDLAEKIIKDPLDVSEVRLLKLAKLRTAIQKITPERGYFGTGWDFLGFLGRESTYGVLENLSGAVGFGGKSGASADWYKRLMDAPIEEVDTVSNQIAKEISDYGIVGDNIFYLGTLGSSIESQGMYENEAFWSLIDIGTLGVGKLVKAAKATEEAVTATRIATAVDPADMKIATNGVAEGDKLVLRALVEGEETSIELARQTAPGVSRVATVNAENAITPTLKPVLEAESVAKVNATLERVAKIYSELRATPEVIASSAARYVEDLQRTTGYGLLNITRDIPIVTSAVKVSAKARLAVPSVEGVDFKVYQKAVNQASDKLQKGETSWSLSAFMKETGLTKVQAFPYVKQLRQDKVIDNTAKILSSKPTEVPKAVSEPLGPVPSAPVSVQESGFDTYSITAYLGKKDGTLWTTEAAARKAAEQLGGTIAKVNDGWAVTRSRNLPIKYLEESSLGSDQQALRSFIFESVLSPEQTTNLSNEAILKSGTSKMNAVIRQIGTDIKKSWRGLNSTEKKGTEQVINDLTTDFARREWYNTAEFKDQYFKHTKEVPSQKVLDHYKLRAEMYETSFILRAEDVLKKSINENQFIGTFNGLGSRRVKKASVAEEETIFDLDSGQLVSAKDIKGKTIYELHGEQGLDIGDFKQYYITGTLKNNRGLTHSDVLGYKPGANRALGNATHFVVQNKVVETVTGTKKTLTPKTILAERNIIQSGKAVTEINNILKAVRQVSIGDAAKIRATSSLDDVVRANNSFNPNIESVSDFLKYMDEAGLGYDDVRVASADEMFEGRSFKDIYDENTNPAGRRPDLILHGYGAKGILMRNPLEAIERDFTRGINIAATTKYFDKATSDFIRLGEKYISNWDIIKKMPKYQQIREAVINSDSIEARAFKREQTVILSRMNEQSNFSINWSRRMTQLNSWIFSKTGREEFGIGNLKVGAMDFMSSDPSTALRGFAFDLKMGWFAVDQLYMQSLSALSIMTIDPKNGLLGALAYTPMRMAIMNRNPAVIKETARRTSKMLGLTEDQFMEMTEHLYNSGRYDIGDTISEIGGGADFGMGYYKRAKTAGRVFFKEGERINRMISHFVAYKNFREKFPTLNVKTSEGKRMMDEFITQRADALTLNMSSVSNAPWQKGFLGLTTQWLSYNARFLENAFLSRSLTKGERAKLALSQVVFFGAAGIGMGSPLNWYLEEAESTMSTEVYTGLRYGIIDYLLTEFTGTPTALGGRAGLGEGIVQLVKDFQTEGALETLVGPATGISYDTFKDGWNILSSLVTGNITMAQIDTEKFFRNIKTVDKAYQTMWAWNTRDIITKKGFEQIRDASTAQIVLNALAVPLQEAQVGFTISEMLTKQRDYTKKMATVAKDLYKRMDVAIDEGDMKTAQDIATEINTIRLGIPVSEMDNFILMTTEGMNSFAEKMIMKAWEEGKTGTALRSQQIINNEE
jgi:hypothetical protein